VTWGELLEFIIEQSRKTGGDFLDESVTLYIRDGGEFEPLDLIEFEESDDVIDAGSVFLTF